MASSPPPGSPAAPALDSIPLASVQLFLPLLTHSELHGFIVLDSEGRFVYVSESMRKLFGFSERDMRGREATDFVVNEDRPALRALWADAAERHRAAGGDDACTGHVRLRHLRADGGLLHVDVRACTDGQFTYKLLVDATEPAALERSLRNFLLATSHDLRTPCYSIQASSMLLGQQSEVAYDGEAHALVHTIDASCSLLQTIIANVLTLKQLQRGVPVTLAYRAFDPRAVINAAMERATALYPSRRVALITGVGGVGGAIALPDVVYGDAERFGDCLTNCLATALRLSSWEANSVLRLRLACFYEDVEEENAGLLSLHADAEVLGRPLTEAECDALLQPFGLAPQDRGGGSGLALHVARGVARAMGGDVLLHGHDDKDGTRVTLHVQLQAAPPGAQLGRSPPRHRAPTPQPEPQQEPLQTLPKHSVHLTPPDEPQLTSRMLECLMHTSDDLFAVCTLLPASGAAHASELYIAYLSPNAQRVLGRTASELVCRDLLTELLPIVTDRDALRFAAAAALAGERGSQLHVPRLRVAIAAASGVAATMACEVAGCAHDGALYLVCRDVRGRDASEAALRAFVLGTSHDLREPCNAVLVAVSLLENRACVAASAEARFLVAAIRASCTLLLGIVVNILTARQLETGTLSLNRVVFDPSELIADVLAACNAARPHVARSGGLTWAKAQGDFLPKLLEGDRDRVAQTLQNLASNACKFACGANIEVRAWMEAPDAYPLPQRQQPLDQASAEPPHWLVLRVADGGQGMSAAQLAACFQAHTAAPTSQGGGTGLGLFISSQFAHLMGGTLTVMSRPGEGAAFLLRVPLRVLGDAEVAAAAATATASAAASTMEAEGGQLSSAGDAAVTALDAAVAEADAVEAASPRRTVTQPQPAGSAIGVVQQQHRLLRALFADDHALNLRLVTRLLETNNFSVTAVADGGAALEALQASASPGGVPFDVAILDMEMPVLRGPEVSQAFRGWERAHGVVTRTPIVALTANAMEEHAAECAATGCDAFLSKPLRADAMAVLRAHAAQAAELRALVQAAREAGPPAEQSCCSPPDAAATALQSVLLL